MLSRPVNAAALLVIRMDGGRVQTREKQGENGSRWREDKVAAITSNLPGDGTPDHPPKPLVTTYVAMMHPKMVEVNVPIWAVLPALGFSAGVAIFFGIVPAFKAAIVHPIDALRHE